MTTSSQVIWKENADGSRATIYSVSQDGTGLWRWELMRSVIDWGIWKVFGQVNLLGITEADNTTIAGGSLLQYVYYIGKKLRRRYKNREKRNAYGGDIKNTLDYDSNLSNRVVFNFMDKIKFDGVVSDVSINFCTPPTLDDPQIKLYVLAQTPDPCTFFVVEWNDDKVCGGCENSELHRRHPLSQPTEHVHTYYKIPVETIKKVSGVQKFKINMQLPVVKGHFLAIAFEPGAGSPFAVDRDEYSVNLNHFQTICESPARQPSRPIVFTNYPNKGVAFNFTVTQRNKGSDNQISPISNTSDYAGLELEAITPASKLKTALAKLQSNTSSQEESELTSNNNFQERVNIARETIIAQSYWKEVIDQIIKEEEKEIGSDNSTSSENLFRGTTDISSSMPTVSISSTLKKNQNLKTAKVDRENTILGDSLPTNELTENYANEGQETQQPTIFKVSL
ncbi:unnamed protein product [Didymodactylos carnosus]|uniref:Uncharacterized protein n=1 Tax=Didymodactylos carnosus TaxID=1234261 RepID=A0A814B9K5_9BILA|nr:unnamed protein product [Didymodactylos carnosus]CAF0925490.1 unnamed protein product [Didymodactylos carnosus]CAF3686926.1 unnamed protein product [Didymodactylos carnosus]CAF3704182.1 unnamed protein product [Didymodactylos carnosus]